MSVDIKSNIHNFGGNYLLKLYINIITILNIIVYKSNYK